MVAERRHEQKTVPAAEAGLACAGTSCPRRPGAGTAQT